MKRSYIREILDATNEKTISFAGGLPNEKLFPKEEIKKAANKVLDNSLSLQYSKSKGDEALREKIAKLYTEKFNFPTNKEEILITTGSQQALTIVCKCFIKNEVIVQSPTYIGALSSFKTLNLSTRDFTFTDKLNFILNENNALYCMSDFINPSSNSLDEKEREEIKKILIKRESFLIEDGAYSLLDFKGNIQKPISAGYKKSFHLGSFSKIIAPGLRVGWIRAEEKYINEMLVFKEAMDLHTPTLNQMLINEFLEENSLDKHLEIVRNDYESKMNFMSKCFKQYLPSFEFAKPKGGMFIYGKFQCDGMLLAKKCLEQNVAFVPASVFYNYENISNEARFNFTNANFEDIEKGIKIISKVLNNENRVKIIKNGLMFSMFSDYLKKFSNYKLPRYRLY